MPYSNFSGTASKDIRKPFAIPKMYYTELPSELCDQPSEMTYSRKIARYLSTFKWYNPQIGKEDAPVLDSGWFYYEHMTLGRYVDHSYTSTLGLRDSLVKACPGETDVKTHLYSFFQTPEDQLADYGVGVGLYFRNLRVLVILFFGAFLIQLYPILYFQSPEYSDGQPGVKTAVRGSAVCTDQNYYPCVDCSEDDFGASLTTRFVNVTSEDGIALTFLKVNDCNYNFFAGLSSWLAFVFISIGIYVQRRKEKKRAVQLDELEQLTADYSICVTNPPLDAKDPKEWKEFFSNVSNEAHATVVTIALDNEKFIKTLIQKRTLLLEIETMLPAGKEMDPNNLKELVDSIPPVSNSNCFDTSATALYEKVLALEEKIEEFSKLDYGVSDVFITFETENQQRSVLEKLSVGSLNVFFNQKGSLPEEYLFRGRKVLNVIEPSEPNSIRWDDLDESFLTRLKQNMFTLFISLLFIFGAGLLILYSKSYFHGIYFGLTVTSLMITFCNTLTPMIVKFLMRFEAHTNQGTYQESLFFKLCIFRWMNTAVIMAALQPFTSTLTRGSFLVTIYSLFSTEIITTPLLQMADYMGHFQRHYVAPRATDQRKMNQQFQGKLYNLSERYTDMNKVVFLAFFYAGIFPMGFLYGAAALLVHYLVDKFCLLRVWKQAPKIGTELTNTSSRFMYVAVLAYVFSSTYSQSAFPYDNACEYQGPNTDNILKKYVGFHNLTSVDDSVNITSINDTKLYKFCNQDFIRDGFKFPFFPEYQGSDKWMTDDQETIVTIFAYTLLFVLGVSVVLYIRYLYYGVKTLFVGTYKPSGEASSVPFSFLHLPAYVPQNKIPDLVYPSFLCNIDDVPHKHIGWDPPRGSYDDHNLIYTVPGIDVGDDANAEKKNSMFSVVKYYPVEENED